MGMFFPAFVAIILKLVYKDSPIYFRTYQGKLRWILYSFLLLTIFHLLVTLAGLVIQGQSTVFQGIGSLLSTLWTLLIFYLAGRSSKEEFEQVGLQLGGMNWGVKLVLGTVAFFALQAGLNLVFGLGQFQGLAERIYGIAIPEDIYPLGLIMALALAVTGVPLSGLAAVFGEEYGWRGFLHDELIKLGKRRGVALVGLVWGIWHFPVILSGIHTYPSTILGLGLGLIFFVLWGFIQSYAVLKTKSIWVAAFLHGVVNSVYAYMLEYVVRPEDKVVSFGLGVYGLACLAVVVWFILRDSIWDHESKGMS
jgi:membrane protease YdiL (CAAX protease family)